MPTHSEDQFHHFIPRFILRNFALPGVASPTIACVNKKKDSIKQKNPLIRTWDIKRCVLEERHVSDVYGYENMYDDLYHVPSEKRKHIEEALGKLEGKAATIIRRIQNEHARQLHEVDQKNRGSDIASSEGQISLTATDAMLLRKFFFIMQFRGPMQAGRYKKSINEYNHNDREPLVSFMKQKGFTEPKQVWLHSLKHVLDTDIDRKQQWISRLQREIYIDTFMSLMTYVGDSYLAFCQPQSSNDEFVLTESCFLIHEGSSECSIDNCGNIIPGFYTQYHKFALISPLLMLVMRLNMEFRGTPETERFRQLHKKIYNHPPSMLADLPVSPPDTIYKSPGTHSEDDLFVYKFFPIPKRHVWLINSVLLNEAKETITFVSKTSMHGSLKAYLEKPQFRIAEDWLRNGKGQVQEHISYRVSKERLLAKLEGKKAVPKIQTATVLQQKRWQKKFETVRKAVVAGFKDSPVMLEYYHMGGIEDNIADDVMQMLLMGKMNELVISVAKQLPKLEGLQVRRALRNFQCQCIKTPVLFLWLHLIDGFPAKSGSLEVDYNGETKNLLIQTREALVNKGIHFNTVMFDSMRKENIRYKVQEDNLRNPLQRPGDPEKWLADEYLSIFMWTDLTRFMHGVSGWNPQILSNVGLPLQQQKPMWETLLGEEATFILWRFMSGNLGAHGLDQPTTHNLISEFSMRTYVSTLVKGHIRREMKLDGFSASESLAVARLICKHMFPVPLARLE